MNNNSNNNNKKNIHTCRVHACDTILINSSTNDQPNLLPPLGGENTAKYNGWNGSKVLTN